MKTISHILIIAFLFIGFFSQQTKAQNENEDQQLNITSKDSLSIHRVAVGLKNKKKVVIKDLLGKINIIGIPDKNMMHISGQGVGEIPERAKGLKSLYGKGYIDNTHIGIYIFALEDKLYVCGASKGSETATYNFYISKNIDLKIDYNSPFAYKDIEIKDMEGEVEVSTLNSGIKCLNITGPLVLNSVNGGIDIAISKLNQANPTSISLVNGELDLTLPVNTPANLEVNTLGGGIYTDFDIKVNAKKDEELTQIGGNNEIETKLNGGGVNLSISNINGNIYLRKK